MVHFVIINFLVKVECKLYIINRLLISHYVMIANCMDCTNIWNWSKHYIFTLATSCGYYWICLQLKLYSEITGYTEMLIEQLTIWVYKRSSCIY